MHGYEVSGSRQQVDRDLRPQRLCQTPQDVLLGEALVCGDDSGEGQSATCQHAALHLRDNRRYGRGQGLSVQLRLLESKRRGDLQKRARQGELRLAVTRDSRSSRRRRGIHL